jgi:hypothetical protein
MTIDRRADYVAVNRSASLDAINEIQATSDEGRHFLNQAWNTRAEDWTAFTHWLCSADVALAQIRSIGNEWAQALTDAPAIPVGQLLVWEQAAEAA